mmetsp:Transcript_53590/g.98704  ORF Transcript_53590/g.98704 Transcript_53590/m.98704 type:complete len:131 (+) Transcript_53590:99-491(+)
MLGRLAAARRFAAMPLRTALNTPFAPRVGTTAGSMAGAVRTKASGPALPITLSVRMDGLMVKCIIAAIIHFVPADAIFLGGALAIAHNTATSSCPKTKPASVDDAIDSFKAKKGLEDVKVKKGRTTYVTL